MRSIEQIQKRIDKINAEIAQLKWKAYNLRAQNKPFREIVVQTVKLAEQQAKLKEELEFRREEDETTDVQGKPTYKPQNKYMILKQKTWIPWEGGRKERSESEQPKLEEKIEWTKRVQLADGISVSIPEIENPARRRETTQVRTLGDVWKAEGKSIF